MSGLLSLLLVPRLPSSLVRRLDTVLAPLLLVESLICPTSTAPLQ